MLELNWSEVWTAGYWFRGMNGESADVLLQSSSWFWFYLILFSATTIVGILLTLLKSFINTEHPFEKKLSLWSANFVTLGVIGLSWFFCRELSLQFLGARIWLAVGLLYILIVLGFLARYFIMFYPMEIQYYRNYANSIMKK